MREAQLKKQSPREGTETDAAAIAPKYILFKLKKQSPREGTETERTQFYNHYWFELKKQSPREGTETNGAWLHRISTV